MKNSDITDPTFRSAVKAIDAGNLLALQHLLEANPNLITMRPDSPTEGYFRNPYLLWFVADNPVRIERLPENILEITKLLIDYAQRNAADSFQQQVDFTLDLVVTGKIPRECGVQVAMIDLLIDAGAVPGNVHGALAHGNVDAARHLIYRGAQFTLAAAVCFNDMEHATHLAKTAGMDDKQAALMAGAMYGHHQMIKMLIESGADVNTIVSSGFHSHASPLHQAVSSGSIESVKILVKAGASLAALDSVYHGTPSGWAKYMQTEKGSQATKENYAEIEAFLLAQ